LCFTKLQTGASLFVQQSCPPAFAAAMNSDKINALPPSALDNLVVVLVRSRNPLNIGAAARAMTNFGPHRLRVVNPYKLAFRDARSAVGAADVLQDAEEFTSIAEAVADCSLVVGTTAVRDRSLNHELRHLDEDTGALIRSTLSNTRAAILFGSEKTGLSNDDFSHCHWLLNIPTRQENISMNLGQAVAVCLYELARGSTTQPAEREIEPASSDQNQMITESLFDALKISGYVKPGTGAMFEKKTRQLILGFNLEAYDAKLFLGMLRQIVWKLRLTPKE
jgi:tRNA/rRNA methyltransferase